MLKLYENGIYLVNGETICSCPEEVARSFRSLHLSCSRSCKGMFWRGLIRA